MKKKIIIGIILILVAALVSFFVIKNIKHGKKEYTIEKVENYSYFVVKEQEKSGVIDAKGNTVIPAEYDEVIIPNPEKEVFICYKENETTVLNSKKEKIIEDYDKVEPIRLKNLVSDLMYEKSVLTYLKNDKMGLIDLEGKKITDNEYESIEALPDQEGKLLVKKNGKIGIININGYKIVECEYDKIDVDGYYHEGDGYNYSGYIVSNTTNEGYRYGYINYKGEKIIEPTCNELSRIQEIDEKENAYLILAKNGQYGVYKNKEEKIKNEYQSIQYEKGNDVFVVERTGKYGIINREAQEIIPVQYSQIDITGICIYTKNESGTSIFDKTGKTLEIDEDTSILNTDNENYKIVVKSNEGQILYGVIDNNGNTLIPQEYKYIEYLYDNHFIVSDQDGKLGVMDDKQNVEVELKYNSLQRIEETKLLQATQEEKVEIYSSNIKQILELENATIEIKDNYMYVRNANETKYIDIQNEKELKNTEMYPNNTLFTTQQNNLWGFADKSGNIKVDCKYEKVTEFNTYGYAGIKQDGKWGVINTSGEIVKEPTYVIAEENEASLQFIGEYYSVEYGDGEIYYTNQIQTYENTPEVQQEESEF